MLATQIEIHHPMYVHSSIEALFAKIHCQKVKIIDNAINFHLAFIRSNRAVESNIHPKHFTVAHHCRPTIAIVK